MPETPQLAIMFFVKVDSLLTEARKVWGNDRLSVEEIVIRMGVVFGDISRIARTSQENGAIDDQELKKEMGNLIFSMIRWCDDLGYSPEECINLAKRAQKTYTQGLKR